MTDTPLPAPSDTLMHQEAAQTADIVADQYARNAATVKALADDLRRNPPPFVVTCARGSSDHAATYAKYLFETQLGVVTASASPSVGSVYEAKQRLAGALYVVISQSGKSPDLLRNATQAKEAGARVVALVNVEDSPLALLADTVLPLRAGPERSVAATKSYLGSLAAILQLAAHWKNEAPLHAATEALPDALRRGRGERGPQKAPLKVPTTIRLSPEVSAAFRATGPGWQTRIDDALKDWLRTHRPA